MTEEAIKAILIEIFNHWQDLSTNEVRDLLRILAARGIVTTCADCGKPIFDVQEISWDHLYPHSCGGPDEIGNRAPMHADCNVKKDSKIDKKYFCYIEPDLLARILKQKKKENKRKRRTERQKFLNDNSLNCPNNFMHRKFNR